MKAVLLGAICAGCGSGGAATDAAVTGADAGLGTGTLTWKDNGAMHTAQFASATIIRSANLDLLEIGAADPSSGLALGVTVQPPPLTPGSYACGGTAFPIVSFSYNGTTGQNQVCAIALTSVGLTSGAHVIGTFSATLAVTGGGTKAITEGRFDIVAVVSSQ